MAVQQHRTDSQQVETVLIRRSTWQVSQLLRIAPHHTWSCPCILPLQPAPPAPCSHSGCCRASQHEPASSANYSPPLLLFRTLSCNPSCNLSCKHSCRLLLLQNGGNFITSNLPTFLVKLLPNITLADGKKLSIGAEAGKVVTALAPLLGSNTTVELPLPGDMAAGVGVSRPSVNVDLIQGINVTLEVVRRLVSRLHY